MGTLLQIYLLAGMVFGLFFVIWGYALLQPSAKGSPVTFRLLLFPACLLLWPYLLIRIVTGNITETE